MSEADAEVEAGPEIQYCVVLETRPGIFVYEARDSEHNIVGEPSREFKTQHSAAQDAADQHSHIVPGEHSGIHILTNDPANPGPEESPDTGGE